MNDVRGLRLSVKSYLHIMGIASIPFVLSGCMILGLFGKKESEFIPTSSDELLLRITGEKTLFQPGEAVRFNVTVINTTDEAITIRPLTAFSGHNNTMPGTLSFYFGPRAQERPVQRYPVISSQEEDNSSRFGDVPIELAAGQSVERSFLMTQITVKSGPMNFQVHMDPFFGLATNRTGKLYSNVVNFEVYGERMFNRDSKGLLDIEDAMRLASDEVSEEVFATDAILFENDFGFYEWYVNVDYSSATGEAFRMGYLVDPYIGFVRDRARPFDPSIKPVNFEIRESGTLPVQTPPSGGGGGS